MRTVSATSGSCPSIWSRHVLLDAGAGQIKDVGHHTGTADVLIATKDVAQTNLQRLFDLLEHRRGDILHRGDAIGDIRLHALGQLRQNARGLRRVELRQDQSDGLGMFVGDERRHLFGGDVPQHVKTRGDSSGDTVENLLRLARADGPFEGPTGEIDAALGEPFTSN